MTTAPHLTVDLQSLAENWEFLSEKAPNAQTSAVVKANAYGLGIDHVVPVLADAGCETFFVAMVEEGVRVRSLLPEARVFVLNGIFNDTVSTAIKHDLAPVLSTFEQISMWTDKARGKPCALHVDTGMNRLGLSLQDAGRLGEDQVLIGKSGARVLMSHLACGDDPNHPLNASQLAKFETIASHFSNLERSLANSAAVLSRPEAHYDLTRPGIAIYGGEAINDIPNPMKPVVTARTRILQVRDGHKGDAVGYGASHVLDRDTKIAICSAGYADGFHRASSGSGIPLRVGNPNGGWGMLGKYRIPIIGRVSMDLTAFDVTDVPADELKHEHWVELFGPNILIDDAARSAGTIGYELLTGLGNRYIREYVG